MAEFPSFRSSINGFNRADVLDYLKGLLNEKNALQSALDSARAAVAEKDAEIENYKKQLSQTQIERQNEQMLGRAMYDARRFSDNLVREANEKANAMLENASFAADDVAKQVQSTIEESAAFKAFCQDSMGRIDDKLNDLLQALAAFQKEVAERKDAANKKDAEPDEQEAPAPEMPIQRLTVRKIKR